jgi:hypothetical protein
MHTPLDPLCCASIGRVLSRKRAFTNCLLTVLSMLHRAYNWEHGLCVYYGVFALNTCTPTLYELIGRRGFICKTPPGIYYTYGFAKKNRRVFTTQIIYLAFSRAWVFGLGGLIHTNLSSTGLAWYTHGKIRHKFR